MAAVAVVGMVLGTCDGTGSAPVLGVHKLQGVHAPCPSGKREIFPTSLRAQPRGLLPTAPGLELSEGTACEGSAKVYLTLRACRDGCWHYQGTSWSCAAGEGKESTNETTSLAGSAPKPEPGCPHRADSG